MTGFRLVVFDWDGTLMDSAARIIACMQGAAAELGLPVLGDHPIREIIGLGLLEACRALYPGRTEAEHRLLADAYRERFLVHAKDPCPLFPGVPEVLESLSRRGYLLAVATGKSRAGLRRCLEESGLERYWYATRCADEAPSKPHPQMLLEIMAELGVAPAATVMVGDTEFDLAMAGNAGTAAVGVCYGAHEPGRLLVHKPLACLESIYELPGLLERVGRSRNHGEPP